MAGEITAQLQILQEMVCVTYTDRSAIADAPQVYTGEITDDDTPLMPTFFYDLPSTLPRRNPYIFVDSPGRGHTLNGSGLQMFNLPEVFSKASFQTTDRSFVVPSAYYSLYLASPSSRKVGQSDDLVVTVYVIADFDSHDGLELAKESLKFVVRVVHSVVDSDAHCRITGIDALGQNPSNLYPKL